MDFKKWFEKNRTELIDAPNTETVAELSWRACEAEIKKACVQAVHTHCEIDGYIGMRPAEIIETIMQAEVK